jgi:hypothetical protein
MQSQETLQQSAAQQAEVLSKAFEIFKERNRVRKDLWARHDPLDHIRMVMEKAQRVEINIMDDAPNLEIAIDDALDGINFLAFIVRKLTGAVPDGGSITE